MFKNANFSYEIKNSKRRRYYAKFQDLALKCRREIFYEMDSSWEVERLLHKLHDSTSVSSNLLGAKNIFLKIQILREALLLIIITMYAPLDTLDDLHGPQSIHGALVGKQY